MKKALLNILLCFSLTQLATAQENKFVLGTVPETDLLMKNYPADLEAEALILYDKGDVYFKIDRENNRINLVYKRSRRIKILKTSALSYANVSIGFFKAGFNRNQKVYDISASSYVIYNGAFQKRNLDPEKVFEEKVNTEYNLKKFSIPNVKVGSVIEYEYTLEVPSSSAVPDWEFQNELPTAVSEFQIALTPFYEYNYVLQGAKGFSATREKESTIRRNYGGIEFTDRVYNFVMKNQPAFKDETFITSKNDYITKLDWQLTGINYPNGQTEQLMSSWPEISNEFLKFESFGKFMQTAYKSNRKKIITELSLDGLTSIEKAKKITAFVKANYTWNGYYQKHTDQTYKEFQKTKEGTSAEINLYLAGLLKATGLTADPVLISTRSHGKVKQKYPMSSSFNASVVLLTIDQSYYLVEATEPLLPFGWLPAQCINESGLIMKKNSGSWIDLSSETTSSIREWMALSIDVENAMVKGQFKKSLTGYDALYLKANPEEITKELSDYEVEGEVVKSNQSENHLPYTISYSAKVPGIDRYGDLINISPFLNKPWGNNPLKAQSRTYAVDLIYKRQRDYISTIAIPEGYLVSSVPEDILIENELVKIIYRSEQKAETVNTEASYLFKKSVYQPQEYGKIRSHINQFIEKFNEHIVLERKK